MIEHSPLRRRPVDQDCLADDVLLGQQTPGVRIGGVIAVIAQHEEIAIRDAPLAAVARIGVDVGLDQGDPVDPTWPSPMRDLVTGMPMMRLIRSRSSLRRGAEDDDIAAGRRSQAVGQSIDEDKLAIVKRRQHGLAIHADAGRDGIDDQKQDERQHDRLEQVDKYPLPF